MTFATLRVLRARKVKPTFYYKFTVNLASFTFWLKRTSVFRSYSFLKAFCCRTSSYFLLKQSKMSPLLCCHINDSWAWGGTIGYVFLFLLLSTIFDDLFSLYIKLFGCCHDLDDIKLTEVSSKNAYGGDGLQDMLFV